MVPKIPLQWLGIAFETCNKDYNTTTTPFEQGLAGREGQAMKVLLSGGGMYIWKREGRKGVGRLVGEGLVFICWDMGRWREEKSQPGG